MFENPRRGRQARNFTTNVPKILDLKSSSEQIFSRKLSLGAPVFWLHDVLFWGYFLVMCRCQILCQNLLVWQFICILYHSTDFTMEPC